MAPLRIRGPRGVSTLNNVQFDNDSYTVLDFQQQVYDLTGIPPSRQAFKYGYPPRSISALVPELGFSSLGINKGEQVIVSEISSPTPTTTTSQAPPPASSRPTKTTTTSTTNPSGPNAVETAGGFLVHRIVPDDNSCLFTSLSLLLFPTEQQHNPQKLRQIVASTIQNNPETYSSAILGQSPSSYISAIQKPSTWGGAIELSILAQHFQVEIDSVDVETGRIDRFFQQDQQQKKSESRCIVIYSGIHYDAATLAPVKDAPSDFHQTLFPILQDDIDQEPILIAAKQLAGMLRAQKAYTNTSTFTLKCQQCGKGLQGEKEAREHASQTGHIQFGEYSA